METRTPIFVIIVAVALTAVACDAPELRPEADVLSGASPELLDRMRATPHDFPRLPTVQLHGDAHVEQYSLTSNAWGLDDFDDSTRGPAFVDIVRFLGSIDLAAQQRGWSRDRERLIDRFFAGYRRGLSGPLERASQP